MLFFCPKKQYSENRSINELLILNMIAPKTHITIPMRWDPNGDRWISFTEDQWPYLLTMINCNPSMDE